METGGPEADRCCAEDTSPDTRLAGLAGVIHVYTCMYVYIHTPHPVDLTELALRIQQSQQRPLPCDIAKEKRWPCPS